MTNDDILAFALKYRYDEPDASGYDFGTRSMIEFAHAIRNAVLEEAAKRIEREPIDLFCMPREMAVTSRAHVADDVRALKTKEGE